MSGKLTTKVKVIVLVMSLFFGLAITTSELLSPAWVRLLVSTLGGVGFGVGFVIMFNLQRQDNYMNNKLATIQAVLIIAAAAFYGLAFGISHELSPRWVRILIVMLGGAVMGIAVAVIPRRQTH